MEAADNLKTDICCYQVIVGGSAPPVPPGSDPVHNLVTGASRQIIPLKIFL